jgi:hypothetical protein
MESQQAVLKDVINLVQQLSPDEKLQLIEHLTPEREVPGTSPLTQDQTATAGVDTASRDNLSWLGCMAGTGEIVGDIISPVIEAEEWEVMKP